MLSVSGQLKMTGRLGTTRRRERASHHGIGGNLKRAGVLVNGYVSIQISTDRDAGNGSG